jgi:hypothetical protein
MTNLQVMDKFFIGQRWNSNCTNRNYSLRFRGNTLFTIDGGNNLRIAEHYQYGNPWNYESDAVKHARQIPRVSRCSRSGLIICNNPALADSKLMRGHIKQLYERLTTSPFCGNVIFIFSDIPIIGDYDFDVDEIPRHMNILGGTLKVLIDRMNRPANSAKMNRSIYAEIERYTVMLYWYMDFFSIPNDLFHSHPEITNILGRHSIPDWQDAEERMVDRGTDGMRVQPNVRREASIEAPITTGTSSTTFSAGPTTTSDTVLGRR